MSTRTVSTTPLAASTSATCHRGPTRLPMRHCVFSWLDPRVWVLIWLICRRRRRCRRRCWCWCWCRAQLRRGKLPDGTGGGFSGWWVLHQRPHPPGAPSLAAIHCHRTFTSALTTCPHCPRWPADTGHTELSRANSNHRRRAVLDEAVDLLPHPGRSSAATRPTSLARRSALRPTAFVLLVIETNADT